MYKKNKKRSVVEKYNISGINMKEKDFNEMKRN
jgi:hypothetical protein